MSHNLQPVPSKEPGLITQKMMMDYLQLEANLNVLEMRFKNAKRELLELLRNEATVQEEGRFYAKIARKERRNVAWREEFEKENGKLRAAELVELTEPTISESPVIDIRPNIKEI